VTAAGLCLRLRCCRRLLSGWEGPDDEGFSSTAHGGPGNVCEISAPDVRLLGVVLLAVVGAAGGSMNRVLRAFTPPCWEDSSREFVAVLRHIKGESLCCRSALRYQHVSSSCCISM